MNTSQLQCCIQCDRLLRGRVTVCAADRLPAECLVFTFGFIVNTDNHSQPGKHWCAFYIYRKGCGEFFDSYSRDPSYYKKDFYSFFSRNALENGLVNRHRLQSNSSNVCGLYCLFYLIRRFNGVSMKNIVNNFSVSDFSLNDLLIYENVTNTFPFCVKNECVFNQKCESLIIKPV